MYSGRLLYVSLILAWASVVGLPLLYYSGVVGMVAPAAASLSLAPGGLRVRAHLAPTAPLSTSTAARGWLSKLWPLRAAAAPSPVPPPPPATSTTPSACFLHTGRLREDAAAAAARACARLAARPRAGFWWWWRGSGFWFWVWGGGFCFF